MHGEVKPRPGFLSVFEASMEDGSRRLATRNLVPGRNVYGERLVKHRNVEYRCWDPFRSKLAAAISKNLKTIPIQPNHRVLYLGAASGTTASHVSDIVGKGGQVYCVEFSSRSMRELVNNVCSLRTNVLPILADARSPEKYACLVGDMVNTVYCDVAQPEQAKILADNADLFLGRPGWVMLAVKAQSIDVTRSPVEVYEKEKSILEDRGFQIQETVHLEPYDKAHAMVVAAA